MKLRNPALALDLECVGIGPDGDKPAALCPWTARIVCAGLYLIQERRALWLYDGTLVDVTGELDGVRSERCEGEAELVTKLNATVDERLKRESCLVTFHGRGYDLPVAMAAAARNGLKPSRQLSYLVNEYRFDKDPRHIDLCEIASFHGAATRPSLRAVSIGLGLADPKADAEGCQVAEWVAARDGNSLRTYNLGDVYACAGIVEKLAAWFE